MSQMMEDLMFAADHNNHPAGSNLGADALGAVVTDEFTKLTAVTFPAAARILEEFVTDGLGSAEDLTNQLVTWLRAWQTCHSEPVVTMVQDYLDEVGTDAVEMTEEIKQAHIVSRAFATAIVLNTSTSTVG